MESVSNFRYITLALALFAAALPASAQTVLARAEANPSVVMEGDTGTYSIRFLNVDSIPNLNTPRVDGIEFGSTPSTSSYRQIINGRVSVETEISWPFRPTRTGSFIIPGRAVEIGGEEIRIPDVEVRAVPMDEETRSRAYLVLQLPDPPYYVGQALPAKLNLLVRRDLNIANIQFPENQEDAYQHTEFSNNPQRGTIQYKGRSYNAVVWDFIVTPIKSGPAELTFKQNIALEVITRSSRFPSIFNMASTRSEPITVSSDPVTTEILSLPSEDRPVSFSGAIGQFTVETDLTDTELTAGEPVTFNLALAGEGNFERIAPPELPQWDHWRVYPPKVDFVAQDELGFKGRKSFEYILIPQTTDITELPGFEYASFDPTSGTYVTTSVDPVPVTVQPSDNPTETAPVLPALLGTSSEQPVVPEKILPIKPNPGSYFPAGAVLWRQSSFWMINGLAGLLIAILALWQWRLKRLQTDDRLARRHSGGRKVRKALQAAHSAARNGNAGPFLESARFAIQESVSHLSTRHLQAKTLVTSDCMEILNQQDLPTTLIEKVQNILATADAHQFAGLSPGKDALLTLDKDLGSIISDINRATR